MVDINNIQNFRIPPPDRNFIGAATAFAAIPETHQEQIVFLDKAAEKYIFEFASAAHLVTGGFWDPFAKGNFKTVEEYDELYGMPGSNQDLKKWLFNRGIPFSTWVFVLMDAEPPMMMTWKMMIKYIDHIFFGSDVMIFDKTLNWCLVYFHENRVFFGKDKVYDPAEDDLRMQELNERKKKYPQFKHPFQ
ncbi:hypothetical protein [Sediminibacterium soli]|uniref:hypothetical protein n=1 Tax=Sediminibacterium soli TaxID=2698829 RepID=UPI00137A5382|nr:hypothetical protein [Sediminibacterium soli]NCI47018.1 hypothetical protein [Sediminibacterium soli]